MLNKRIPIADNGGLQEHCNLQSLHMHTVEPVYYGHLIHKCPDYQGVLIFQINLYDKVSFETITKCVDYAGVLIFK